MTATVGSIVFFLITNLGSWFAMTEDYPRTLAGLVDCYIAGLPFFRNTLTGDLVFSAAFFGIAYLVKAHAGEEASAAA